MAKLILTNAIAEDLKTAASDSFIDSLKMIEVDDIQPNEDNFYEMAEIEELAEDIERQGLMSVLVATAAENGKYKIDGNLVSELAHSGLLYQDKKGNAVFLHKDDDGETVGAELQGTSTYQRFKGVTAGTADSVFSVKIGKPNKAYIFESAIDLLSFRQLAGPNKLRNCLLVSMAGLKPSTLNSLVKRGLALYACVDNDEAGARFISVNNLIPCNRVLIDSGVKDFNELLQKTVRTRELIDKSQSAQNLPTDPSNVKLPPPSHKVWR